MTTLTEPTFEKVGPLFNATLETTQAMHAAGQEFAVVQTYRFTEPQKKQFMVNPYYLLKLPVTLAGVGRDDGRFKADPKEIDLTTFPRLCTDLKFSSEVSVDFILAAAIRWLQRYCHEGNRGLVLPRVTAATAIILCRRKGVDLTINDRVMNLPQFDVSTANLFTADEEATP